MKTFGNILVYFSVLVMFNSCYYSYPPSPSLNETAESYERALSLYPDSLVSFLPDIYQGNLFNFSKNDQENDSMKFIGLVFSYPKSYVKKLEKELKKSAKSVYFFKDECLRIINYSQDRPIERINIFPCVNSIDKLPVPNFSFLSSPAIPNNFFKKGRIYVLDAGELKSNNYSLKGNSIDSHWEHGYSTGVVLQGNIVAYWLEVW